LGFRPSRAFSAHTREPRTHPNPKARVHPRTRRPASTTRRTVRPLDPGEAAPKTRRSRHGLVGGDRPSRVGRAASRRRLLLP
jgi:hypothetical protein